MFPYTADRVKRGKIMFDWSVPRYYTAIVWNKQRFLGYIVHPYVQLKKAPEGFLSKVSQSNDGLRTTGGQCILTFPRPRLSSHLHEEVVWRWRPPTQLSTNNFTVLDVADLDIDIKFKEWKSVELNYLLGRCWMLPLH